MMDSLYTHTPSSMVVAFCMDNESVKILSLLNRKNIIPLHISAIENNSLKDVKKNRSIGEYCWTCKASSILYVFNNYNCDSCAYVDADLYFFSSPSTLIHEFEDADVILTPHNFTEKYDSSDSNGYYCAQYLAFRNTKNSHDILNWWSEKCIEWCYGIHQDGKYGDQKYLEEVAGFASVCASGLSGILAPWNIQKYNIKNTEDKIVCYDSMTESDVIFYHFHDFRFIDSYKRVNCGNYDIDNSIIDAIYKPYYRHLYGISFYMRSITGVVSIDDVIPEKNFRSIARNIRRLITDKPIIRSVDLF